MARKFNSSQMKSKIRHAENRFSREINNYNRVMKKVVNDYNRAVRQHNAKVIQDRSRIQRELRRLNSSDSLRISNSYKLSVDVLHSSYERVSQNFDYGESVTPFQEYIYESIENENANSLETANIILDNYLPDLSGYSLRDTIILDQLSSISKDLDNRWRGAIFSLNPDNPDATRHFCTSAREIFTGIFESKATDEEVFEIFPDCDRTERGNATRRSKIKYFLHKKKFQDESAEVFVENDIENILALFHELSTGTHGKAGKYSHTQLISIKKRVEDGLVFLCNIAG